MRPSPPSTSLPSQPSKKDGRSFRIGPRSVGRRASLLLRFDTAAGSDEPCGVGGPGLAPDRGDWSKGTGRWGKEPRWVCEVAR